MVLGQWLRAHILNYRYQTEGEGEAETQRDKQRKRLRLAWVFEILKPTLSDTLLQQSYTS